MDEDILLCLWDSPPADIGELLSPLPPSGEDTIPASPEATCHMWASVQNMPVAGEGVGSDVVAYGGCNACPEPVADGSMEEFSGAVLDPGIEEMPLLVTSIWTPFAGPDCTTCCVLRDVVHSSDRCRLTLSIHGDLGSIRHALLVIHHFMNGEEKYIADLSSFDAGSVKQFLVEYGHCCYRDGQVLVEDTPRSFYDVLSVNMNYTDEYYSAAAASLQIHHEDVGPVAALPPPPWYPNLITEVEHLPQASQEVTSEADGEETDTLVADGEETDTPAADGEDTDQKELKAVLAALLWAVPELRFVLPLWALLLEGSCFPPHEDLGEEDLYLQVVWGLQRTRTVAGLGQSCSTATSGHKLWIRKTGIAAQRERTGLLTFGNLASVFHRPITTAAMELQICTTALKKVCRKYDVYRWPHRKVISSAKRISSMLQSFHTQCGEEAAKTLCLLYAERRELRILYRVRV